MVQKELRFTTIRVLVYLNNYTVVVGNPLSGVFRFSKSEDVREDTEQLLLFSREHKKKSLKEKSAKYLM